MKSIFIVVIAVAFAAVLLVPTMTYVEAANVGDGTSHVDVYDYPFEISLVEHGIITIHNQLDRIIDIGTPDWFVESAAMWMRGMLDDDSFNDSIKFLAENRLL